MVRRSTRKGVQKAKAKASAYVSYLQAPDHKVLSRALPPPQEQISKRTLERSKVRLNASKRIPLALTRGKKQNALATFPTGPNSRHILFMNLGDERILEAVQWLSGRAPRPPWTTNVTGLESKGMTLYLNENGKTRPFALTREKRMA